MTASIRTTIDIAAPPQTVWAALTDFAAMPAWNPFIRQIAGELRVGATLSVAIAPPGRTAMRFRPRLLAVEPERELRWRGSVLVRGLFDGEHSFRLEPLPGGGTRFRQDEDFSGLLVPLAGKGLLSATEGGFQAMNESLKRHAEQRTSP